MMVKGRLVVLCAMLLGGMAGTLACRQERTSPKLGTPESRFNRFGEMLRTTLPEVFASEFRGKITEVNYKVEQKDSAYTGTVRFRVSGELSTTRGKGADIVLTSATVNEAHTSEDVAQGWEVALYRFTDNKWVFTLVNPTRSVGSGRTMKYIETLMKTDGF